MKLVNASCEIVGKDKISCIIARVYNKWERVSYFLHYCVVALVQGHDLYNHIHACGKPQGYKQGYIVLLYKNMIIKVMTLNKSYYTVV